MGQNMGAARDIYGPWRDFLIFGGASVLILPWFLLWQQQMFVPFFVAGIALSNILNNPHFAYSYQMFYDRFIPSLKNPDLKRELKLRYINAGIVVPLVMAAFFALCVVRQDVKLLSYAIYVMTFTVGWHYVKQGYGILIVDSVFKKAFFSPAQKRLLFWNALIFWIFSWLFFNHFLQNYSVWDIYIFKLPIPAFLLYAAGGLAFVSSVMTLTVLGVRVLHNKTLINGTLAYVAAVYIWLFGLQQPLLLLLIPSFHSLQYIGMVWRYNANRLRGQEGAEQMQRGASGYGRFLNFMLTGIILGYLGFWLLPEFFDSHVPYAKSLFGQHMFLFIFWMFINIHHYFIDNVIWRSDNPDVKAYLFS